MLSGAPEEIRTLVRTAHQRHMTDAKFSEINTLGFVKITLIT